MLDHRPLHQLRHGRAAAVIDVEAVRLDPEADHFGAELPEDAGCHHVGSTMGAVDHDLEAAEAQAARQGRLQRLDIALAGALQADRAAELGGLGQAGIAVAEHARLDRQLDRVGQLEAVRAEQLDAVVLIGIVRGRDHDAEIGAQGPGQQGHARGRQRPEQRHVHAHGDEARGQRRLQHVAGQPGVLADHDPVAVTAAGELRARRQAQLQRGLGGHGRLIGGAADAIGAKELSGHGRPRAGAVLGWGGLGPPAHGPR